MLNLYAQLYTFESVESPPPNAPVSFAEALEDGSEDGISLIASGYEWICPKCECLNLEIEITEAVTCDECESPWPVADHFHAY